MVTFWTFQIVTYLPEFTLVVSPDLVATTGASALIHVGDVFFLCCGLPLETRTSLWRRLARMRGFPSLLLGFGFCLFLQGLSVGAGHNQSLG
jgi:hypothetical protein